MHATPCALVDLVEMASGNRVVQLGWTPNWRHRCKKLHQQSTRGTFYYAATKNMRRAETRLLTAMYGREAQQSRASDCEGFVYVVNDDDLALTTTESSTTTDEDSDTRHSHRKRHAKKHKDSHKKKRHDYDETSSNSSSDSGSSYGAATCHCVHTKACRRRWREQQEQQAHCNFLAGRAGPDADRTADKDCEIMNEWRRNQPGTSRQ